MPRRFQNQAQLLSGIWILSTWGPRGAHQISEVYPVRPGNSNHETSTGRVQIPNEQKYHPQGSKASKYYEIWE